MCASGHSEHGIKIRVASAILQSSMSPSASGTSEVLAPPPHPIQYFFRAASQPIAKHNISTPQSRASTTKSTDPTLNLHQAATP